MPINFDDLASKFPEHADQFADIRGQMAQLKANSAQGAAFKSFVLSKSTHNALLKYSASKYDSPQSLNLAIKNLIKDSEDLLLKPQPSISVEKLQKYVKTGRIVHVNEATKQMITSQASPLAAALAKAKSEHIAIKVTKEDKVAGTSEDLDISEMRADDNAYNAIMHEFIGSLMVIDSADTQKAKDSEGEKVHSGSAHATTVKTEHKVGRKRKERTERKADKKAAAREKEAGAERAEEKLKAQESKKEASEMKAKRNKELLEEGEAKRTMAKKERGQKGVFKAQ